MNSKFYINVNNDNFFSENRNKNPNIPLIDMCKEFIKTYGKYIKYKENGDDDEDEDEIENVGENENKKEDGDKTNNKNNNEDVNENENKKEDDNKNETDNKNKIENTNENKSISNQNNQIEKIKGSEIKTPKSSFISLKMEIDTVIMFKLLIVLMIITIVMIVIFLLRIEFKPLINYKIPDDYNYNTIQPPRNNVKKYSIYNKNNDSGITTLFNLNKDKPKVSKSEEIKQEIIDEVKPVMDSKEEFRDKPIKSEYFSSNYEFGI
jgi:hypothetical protein